MTLPFFNNADPSAVHDALGRDCAPDQIASVFFRVKVPPARTNAESEQWLRLRGILGCPEVYQAFGINSLPIDIPATFNYATGLETIGTLANLLTHGGVHRKFVDGTDDALGIAREFLDAALLRQYDLVEAYSCRDSWCDWFVGERVLDETVLIGYRDEWWLLAVTGTD